MQEFEDKNKLGYLITDKKISVLSSVGGQYMYGLMWEDIKYKWNERKEDQLLGYHFFPKESIDFGDHPIFKSKFAKGMPEVWAPLPVRDSDEFVELIERYSAGIEEKTKEALEEEGILEVAPKFTTKEVVGFALKLGFVILIFWGLNTLKNIGSDSNDKRYLSVEERKKIYSGQYSTDDKSTYNSIIGTVNSGGMLKEVLDGENKP